MTITSVNRRVAVCRVNNCCPFRSNLCHVGDGCHGSIEGRKATSDDPDYAMVTLDDEIVILMHGVLTFYANAQATLFRNFDRGSDMSRYVDKTLTLKPLPKKHKPGRLKNALAKSQIML